MIVSLILLINNGQMESNTNNVISFQKQAPVSFNQSLNMFFTQNLRLLGYLKCSIV
jgi:hypothetical protein